MMASHACFPISGGFLTICGLWCVCVGGGDVCKAMENHGTYVSGEVTDAPQREKLQVRLVLPNTHRFSTYDCPGGWSYILYNTVWELAESRISVRRKSAKMLSLSLLPSTLSLSYSDTSAYKNSLLTLLKSCQFCHKHHTHTNRNPHYFFDVTNDRFKRQNQFRRFG